jgi:hypothetical protein
MDVKEKRECEEDEMIYFNTAAEHATVNTQDGNENTDETK